MWSNLPFDLLAKIFSYLSPDSLAGAKAACRSWRATADCTIVHRHVTPWFVAFPIRSSVLSCFIHNPTREKWHVLHLDHVTSPIRPIATIGGLVLMTFISTTYFQLAIYNPFTRQIRSLPMLNVTRINPAVGLVQNDNPSTNVTSSGVKIYVAGGMSVTATGGCTVYESTVEMYDSENDTWQVIGPMPVEFAVRLTVWTPSESVYSKGTLYWMTSARVYSIMTCKIETNTWRVLSVPMGDRLEFAALVSRNGNPTVVGGTYGEGACVWELMEGDVWNVVEKLPSEMGIRLLGDKLSWSSVKCVGASGAVCLYRDIGSGVVVWKEVFGGEGKWEWDWIEGCCSIGGTDVPNFSIKGLLMHPNVSHFSSIF